MALEVRSRPILRFGLFEVDVGAGELRKPGVRIKLQEQPFCLPTLKAKLALLRSNPQQALDSLQAAPCELGLPAIGFYNWPNRYPVYVWRHIRAAKPHRSFRKSSTIAALCSTNPSARWLVSNWDAPTRSRETRPKPASPTRISSRCGKTLMPTSRSLFK